MRRKALGALEMGTEIFGVSRLGFHFYLPQALHVLLYLLSLADEASHADNVSGSAVREVNDGEWEKLPSIRPNKRLHSHGLDAASASLYNHPCTHGTLAKTPCRGMERSRPLLISMDAGGAM